MSLSTIYKTYRDKWWALPLLLPLVLLPLAQKASTFTHFDTGIVSLYYLPLALMLSLMLFFDWAAIPGIMLSIWLFIGREMSSPESVGVIFHFLIPVILSWGGYRVFAPGRHQVSYGDPALMPYRLFWQMFFPATVFQLLLQFAVLLGMFPEHASMSGISPFTLRSLINYQSLLVGCLTGVPLFYLVIRLIRHPRHLRGFISQLRNQFDKKTNKIEVVIWLLVLIFLLALLLMPMNSSSSIFSTNYTLSLILPVMLWASMRFGYRFMSIVWPVVLIVCVHFFYRYLPVYPGYSTQLAITSSSYLIFSFIVVYVAMLATRQRISLARVKRMVFLDPVVHLPNLRALSRTLNQTPWSVLCFMRVPELEVLGRNYGLMLRIQYKQRISQWLEPLLQKDEAVYQLSGHDLVMRLNTDGYQQRIALLDERLKEFRFVWDGMPLQPKVGLSYCYVRAPVSHLPMLLGELSTIADWSVITGQPESVQRRSAIHLQQILKNKVTMMNRLLLALDNDRFCLMAQPIVGIRGDNHYEVLLRMVGDDGSLVMPAEFLPVANEFGLSSRIDIWVLENTLRFMDRERQTLPGLRLAVNVSPSSACNHQFSVIVDDMLKLYHIEAWQLIIEVTESHSLSNPQQVSQTLEQLQALGCLVAIDDFGTGYASYAQLKSVKADILKIDGSFIRNMVNSSLDYQIVSSICHLARMKKMRVVAEDVESEAIRKSAIGLGIDYLQGFAIGEPAPLEALVAGRVGQSGSGGDNGRVFFTNLE